MATRPSRLERITNLFLALLDAPRPLSLREIGTAVAGYPSEPGALRQAFERDKRTLREEGVPIAVERIGGEDQVGYRILPEDYYLPELDLEPDEREALAFALAAVRLEGGAGAFAAAKLSPAQGVDVGPVALLPALPALGVLQGALRDHALVSFAYRGRAREVEGHGLVFRLGAWYFVGADRCSKGAVRTFRVDRIEGEVGVSAPGAYEPPAAEVLAQVRFAPFVAPYAGAGDRPHDEDGPEVVEVTLEVDVRELRYASAMFGDAALVERLADGAARFCFPVADEAAFVAFVLGLGDAVEVLAPPPLRAAVMAKLERLAGLDETERP